jgi:hypothetical protein
VIRCRFDEDLLQVLSDGAGATEQPGADFGIGQAVAGHPRDLGLLPIPTVQQATQTG